MIVFIILNWLMKSKIKDFGKYFEVSYNWHACIMKKRLINN